MKSAKAWGQALVACVICSPLCGQTSPPSPNANPAPIPLRIIVVSSLTQAQQVLDRLKKGEDFAVLAKEKSIDATASSGGYMGPIAPAMLRTELKDAVAGVAPGQLSSIAHIPEGYAILKVLPADTVAEMESSNRNRLTALSQL